MTLLQLISRKFKYSSKEWTGIKLLTAALWLSIVIPIIRTYHSIPFPDGVCLFFDFNFMLHQVLVVPFILLAILASVSYVLDKYIALSLFTMLAISLLFFSVERSNGIYNYNELFSILFLLQGIVFCIPETKISKPNKISIAMLFSIQTISTAYVISAITKLQISGLDWILSANNIAVEIIKSGCQKTIDTQYIGIEQYARYVAAAILNNPLATKVAFTVALVIEFCAFSASLSKSIARKYGWLIALLHVGLFLVIGILIIPFAALVLIYLLNPVGAILNLRAAKQVKLHTDTTLLNKANYVLNKLQFKELLVWLCLPLCYLGSTKYVGDIHPFSNFPMYSYFPTSTNFYYLQNENNEPISTYKILGMRTSNLKQMVLVRNTNNVANPDLKAIGKDVLLQLKQENSAVLNSTIKELKLVQHSIAIQHNTIFEGEIILATIQINPLP